MFKNLIKTVSILLLLTTPCWAATLTIPTSYSTNGQVTSTNLNGNFTAVAAVVNGGLDNTNVDTASGYRLPETKSSLPTAGTQGRVIFLTSDNSLNFDTGAAWIKAISVSGTSAQGDVIYYNGVSWASLATGTSGQYLKANGAASNPSWATLPSDTTAFKIGTFSRDSTTSSGTQAVTGVGFQPTQMIFFMDDDATAESSYGLDNGTTSTSVFSQTASAFNQGGSAIFDYEDVGKSYAGAVSAFGADGFTITWTKTGSPSGTLHVAYMAFK